MSNCKYCSTDYSPTAKHQQYCSNACRQKAFRERNGLDALPNFSSMGNANKQTAKSSIGNASSNKPLLRVGFDRERAKLLSEKAYWQAVAEDARKKVFPIGALVSGAAGYKFGSMLKLSTVDKLLIGLVTGLVGKELFDNPRNESKKEYIQQVTEKAKEEIKRINEALNTINQFEMRLLEMREQGKIAPKTNQIAKIMAADEYVKKEVNTIGLDGKWKYLIGDPNPGFLMLLTGMPGGGKTTFAIEFAQYLQNKKGHTLYIASEQPNLNLPLQSLLKQFGATFAIHTKPTIESLFKDVKGYKFVIIDSVNHLGIDAAKLEELRRENPKLSIVAIMQSTKDGNFKGNQEFLHNADIRVELDKRVAKQTKSRYAAPAEVPNLVE